MNYLAIKCICRKLRAVNKLIDSDFTFKFDEPTGIMYVIYRDNCIYFKDIPKPLFNTLRRQKIANAEASLISEGYKQIVRLTYNNKVYNLHGINKGAASIFNKYEQHFPPNCIYPIKQKLYMGVASDSMFIGDRIYHSCTGYGLYEINNELIVSLTNNGPEILKGVKTTMSTGGYEKFGQDKGLQLADFRAYGLTFDDPNNSDGYESSSCYPLFRPIMPANVWENNIGQLVVDGHVFNNEMCFKSINFHKGEDWPIEIIYNDDGKSERFNIIEAIQGIDMGYCVYDYMPFLVNRQNIAIPFGDEYYYENEYPRNNKYGEIMAIECNYGIFSTTMSEKSIKKMYKDRAGNYYGLIYEKNYVFNPVTDSHLSGKIFKTFYLKNAKSTHTKPALH